MRISWSSADAPIIQARIGICGSLGVSFSKVAVRGPTLGGHAKLFQSVQLLPLLLELVPGDPTRLILGVCRAERGLEEDADVPGDSRRPPAID